MVEPQSITVPLLFEHAERELQQLIAEAAVAGDYAGVRNAARVAEQWSKRHQDQVSQEGDAQKWAAFKPKVSETNRYILEVLLEAENGFKGMITQAAESGNYGQVDLVRSHGGWVKVIIGAFEAVVMPSSKNDMPSVAKSKSLEAPKVVKALENKSKTPQVQKPVVNVMVNRAASPKYPKFQVKQKHVLRIGWSKTENCEYIHRVPISTYRDTVTALDNLAKVADGPLDTDRIQQEVQRICRQGIRSHEVYTVLGMLKEQGVIEAAGADVFLVPANVGVVAQTTLSA